MSDKNNNLILGLALIGGAWYFTRKGTLLGSTGTVVARPGGTGSMPGSVGTGVAQQLGGILGNLLAPKSGGGTSTGAPVTNPNPSYAGDPVINNSVPAADPDATFDPTGNGISSDDWLGIYFS